MKLQAQLAQVQIVQYTVRGIPPEVDRALRKKAAQLKISLNQLVVDELTRATVGGPRKADFSDLVGQWTPDPAFDRRPASNRLGQVEVDRGN
jgi:hypothetical protein